MNRSPPAVFEHAAFAAHGFRDEPSAGIVGKDRAGRVELDHLHIDQFGAGPVPIAYPSPVPLDELVEMS